MMGNVHGGEKKEKSMMTEHTRFSFEFVYVYLLWSPIVVIIKLIFFLLKNQAYLISKLRACIVLNFKR